MSGMTGGTLVSAQTRARTLAYQTHVVDDVLVYCIDNFKGRVNGDTIKDAAVALGFSCNSDNIASFLKLLNRDLYTMDDHVSESTGKLLMGKGWSLAPEMKTKKPGELESDDIFTVPEQAIPTVNSEKPLKLTKEKASTHKKVHERKGFVLTPEMIRQGDLRSPITGSHISPRTVALLYHMRKEGGSIKKHEAREFFPGIVVYTYHGLFQNLSNSNIIEKAGNGRYRPTDKGNRLLDAFSQEALEAVLEVADASVCFKKGMKKDELTISILKYGIKRGRLTREGIADAIIAVSTETHADYKSAHYIARFKEMGFITEAGLLTQPAIDYLKRYEARKAPFSEKRKPKYGSVKLQILIDGMKNNDVVDEKLVLNVLENMTSDKYLFPSRARDYMKNMEARGFIENGKVTKKGIDRVNYALAKLAEPPKNKAKSVLGRVSYDIIVYSLERYDGEMSRNIVKEYLSQTGRKSIESSTTHQFKKLIASGYVKDGRIADNIRQLVQESAMASSTGIGYRSN
ncbi:MAG: hypothetical protein NT129_00425 [Candidatus Aenigmarchaeota archaeon]|nr:hypothetical protein [Candidatus Aenigmarchaeota archaeon]